MSWLVLWICAFSISSDPSPEPPPVHLLVDGTALSPDRYAVVAMPGDTVLFCVRSESGGPALWSFGSGSPRAAESGSVAWIAPRAHGVVDLTIQTAEGSSCRFSILLPVDARRWRTQTLNSFPIGSYGDGNTRDALPSRFFELTSANSGVRVSTHLTLGEFLGHVEGAYPQYMALDMRLVDKLEAGLRLISMDYLCPLDVAVLSGFRTPAYNRAIGNETDASMHLYGSAADVWLESFPPNGLMDDLDRNKRIDVFDGEYMVEVFRTAEASGLCGVGGISAYRWTPGHGPFVHVDVRGRPATWQTQRNLVENPVI